MLSFGQNNENSLIEVFSELTPKYFCWKLLTNCNTKVKACKKENIVVYTDKSKIWTQIMKVQMCIIFSLKFNFVISQSWEKYLVGTTYFN